MRDRGEGRGVNRECHGNGFRDGGEDGGIDREDDGIGFRVCDEKGMEEEDFH